MAIGVTCRCGKKLRADEDLAGKRTKCPECGQIFVVPLLDYDVFVSYSQPDNNTAEAIRDHLENDGIRCWIAPRDITPGNNWGQGIIEGISRCRIFVLVYSAHSNTSQQVHREVELADAKGLALIPFRIDDVPMMPAMEFFLSNLHWLDALTPPLEKHLHYLRHTVRSLLRKKERPSSPPGFVGDSGHRPLLRSEPSAALNRVEETLFTWHRGWRYLLLGTAAVVTLLVAAVTASIIVRNFRVAGERGSPVKYTVSQANGSPDRGHTSPSMHNHSQAHKGMVYIAPGQVHLGSSEEKLRSHAMTLDSIRKNPALIEQFVKCCRGEKEQTVQVAGFWIDKYEVTNAEYGDFLQETHRLPPAMWGGARPLPGTEDHPVTDVSYADAAAYAAWAGKQLPTIAQWTRAFRGNDERMYPWGDEWIAEQAKVSENPAFALGTSSVSATPNDISPFGVCNLVGNVDEIMRERTDRLGRVTMITKGAHAQSSGAVYGAAPFEFYLVGDNARNKLTGFRCACADGNEP